MITRKCLRTMAVGMLALSLLVACAPADPSGESLSETSGPAEQIQESPGQTPQGVSPDTQKQASQGLGQDVQDPAPQNGQAQTQSQETQETQDSQDAQEQDSLSQARDGQEIQTSQSPENQETQPSQPQEIQAPQSPDTQEIQASQSPENQDPQASQPQDTKENQETQTSQSPENQDSQDSQPAQSAQTGTKKFGFTYKGVRYEIGADAEPAMSTLGEANDSREVNVCANGYINRAYTYGEGGGQDFEVYVEQDRDTGKDVIASITLLTANVATEEGLKVGDDAETVLTIYPAATKGLGTYKLTDNGELLYIKITGGKVAYISYLPGE